MFPVQFPETIDLERVVIPFPQLFEHCDHDDHDDHKQGSKISHKNIIKLSKKFMKRNMELSIQLISRLVGYYLLTFIPLKSNVQRSKGSNRPALKSIGDLKYFSQYTIYPITLLKKVPGHFFTLQDLESLPDPKQVPPFFSTLTFFLVLYFDPGPHVLEHCE